MLSYLFIYFKRRSIFLSGGIALLAVAIFLGQGQELSWAAPEQSPYSQTIPPRPPTPTPVRAEPTPAADKNDDRDPGDDVSAPTELPEQSGDVMEDETNSSLQPPLPEDGAKNDEALLPSPSTEQGNSGDNAQTLPSVQPAEREDEEELPVVPQQADLNLSLRADKAVADVGETLTFIVELSNRGPDNATHIAVSNSLPAELSLNTVTSSHGNFNRDRGLWSIAGITAGQTVSLSLRITATGTGAFTNITEIIAADQFDPDSTPGNGLSREDDQVSALVTVSAKTEQRSQSLNSVAALAPTPLPSLQTRPPLGEVGLPLGLFSLMGGLALVLLGLFLVRRS